MTCRSSLALLCLFALAPFAIVCAAQDGGQFPIKANVREVSVPAVVVDQTGNYVADLDRGDFTVFENGKPQKIIAFTKPSAVSPSDIQGPAAAPAHATPNAPPSAASQIPRQTYLICLDPLHMAFSHFAQVRQALQKFFARQTPADSQYVLVVLGWQLHVLVDSTRDPAKIMAAIDGKDFLKSIQDSEAANISRETDRFARLVSSWCGSCNCQSPERDMDGQMCPTLKSQVQTALLSFSERMASRNQSFFQELDQTVAAISRMPTGRTVLFISDGFNRFPGEELYTILRSANVGDTSLLFNPRDLQPQLNAILKLAVRNDVRFYTIDSRGLYTGSEVPGTGENASSRGTGQEMAQNEMALAWFNGDGMAELARKTGGQFFNNSNDLLKGIERTFDDERQQYILAYTPSNTKLDGKFRRITVKLKEKNLRVAAKSGYWASP